MSDAFDSNYRDQFEKAWRDWRSGKEPPPWQSFLPGPEESCSPALIELLLRIDIEERVKAGLPALLSENYFKHLASKQADFHLDAEQQRSLICWEYLERRRNGEAARRIEYQNAFPEHADALSNLKPSAPCPRCHKVVVQEETCQTLVCPDCEGDPLQDATLETLEIDLRDYELIVRIDKESIGGMGEVYRSSDPALGRDLALKVIGAKICKDVTHKKQFVREARITGSLQHPNIVAVHNLGRLPNGRLHYTMRLVHGRTFDKILNEKAGQADHLPTLLVIFEKICQAVAYAHSKHVIHRDLKPANVMVDKFDVVQVMDWGLAKELSTENSAADAKTPNDAVGTQVFGDLPDSPLDVTELGKGKGTPAYVSPEQANGDWVRVDKRTDVFALGLILYEILTGRQAYKGNRDEVMQRARQGDLTEALVQLEQCGADTALTDLCRECLARDRESRPHDGDAVAKRVAAYQATVQERSRNAALDQARLSEALARAAAERRAKHRLLALTVAVMLLIAGGAVVLWWEHRLQEHARRQREQIDRQQESVDRSVAVGLAEAELLEKQGQADPLHSDKYRQALQAARVAAQLEGVSAEVHQHAEDVVGRLTREVEETERGRRFVAALEEAVASKAEIDTHENRFASERAVPRFREAFRSYGMPVGEGVPQEVAKRVKELDVLVRQAILNAVDEWILLAEDSTLKVKEPHLDWLRCFLDAAEPEGWEKEVREAAVESNNIDVLLGTRRTLKELADNAEVDNISAHALTRLVPRLMKSEQKGDRESLMKLLQRAQIKYPNDFWISFYLVYATHRNGNIAEAARVLTAVISLRPNNAGLYTALGVNLRQMGDLDGAILCYEKAIKLSPKYAMPYNNLGSTWMAKGEWERAKKSLEKAIEIEPKFHWAHYNLGRLRILAKITYRITCPRVDGFHSSIRRGMCVS